MSIEKSLERIADSLGLIAAAATLGGTTVNNIGAEAKTPEPEPEKETAAAKKKRLAAEKKAAEAEADPLADEKPVSKDDVRAALQDFIATDGKDAAIALLTEHADGAENLSQLKPEHHAAVFEAIAGAS